MPKALNDLTGTICAGHRQPLNVWILCLYFMGLNLSNNQIAKELDLNRSDVQQMSTQLRKGLIKKPDISLLDEVEYDEVNIFSGHKGNPLAVIEKGRQGHRNRLKGAHGKGTLEKEKPPEFGMIQRCGEVVIRIIANVRQKPLSR